MATRDVDIETLTKQKFLDYCRLRKNMDADFPKPIIKQYEDKITAYEAQKERQRIAYKQGMESDPDFRAKMAAKAKIAYQKQKDKKKLLQPTKTDGEYTEMAIEEANAPIRRRNRTPKEEEVKEEPEEEERPPSPPVRVSRIITRVNALY
jgi:hypothetical protein